LFANATEKTSLLLGSIRSGEPKAKAPIAPDFDRRRTSADLADCFLRRFGAEEGTRTPTPLRVRGPEPRASANSATSARDTNPAISAGSAASLSLAKRARHVKSAASSTFLVTSASGPPTHPASAANRIPAAAKGFYPPGPFRWSDILRNNSSHCQRSESAAPSPRTSDRAN
jgi:hypothetical protein